MARKPKRDLTVEEQLARGPMDLPFLMLVMILLGIGLIMMFSASYATAYYDSKVADPLYYIKRQAMFAVVGVAVMYVVSKINYQTFRWMSVPALIFSIILLLLVFTPLGRSHGPILALVCVSPRAPQPQRRPAVAVSGCGVPAVRDRQNRGHPVFCRPAL